MVPISVTLNVVKCHLGLYICKLNLSDIFVQLCKSTCMYIVTETDIACTRGRCAVADLF